MNKLLIITDTDSRIKWSHAFSQYFENFDKHFVLKNNNAPYDFEILRLDNKQILKRSFLNNYDVIILALGGGANHKFIIRFHKIFKTHCGKRPILITGLNGISDPENLHAFLCRVGSDYICLNSLKDYKVISAKFKALNITTNPLYLSGYIRKAPIKSKTSIKDTILFVCQPNAPKTIIEQEYVISKLASLANAFPDKTILIKPRSKRLDKGLTNTEKYYFHDIYRYLIKKKPSNLHFVYKNIETLLTKIDLCITIGSTVALEAINHKCQVAILSDFGIRNEYGNQHFINSGCFISFDELIQGKTPSLCPDWEKENAIFDSRLIKDLVSEIEQKTAEQKQTGDMLELNKIFYNEKQHTYLFRTLQKKKTKRRIISKIYEIFSELTYIFKT